MSLPSPCSREIYSLENLNAISAAIFQPRMEKKHSSRLQSNLVYFWLFDDAESLWDASFHCFEGRKSPKVRAVRVWKNRFRRQ